MLESGPASILPLKNGNYVVASPNWNNAKGAVTWGNGSSGIVGIISSSNSLIGSSTADRVGGQVFELANGNYVAISPGWTNGSMQNVGAATWANGRTGTSGTVNATNSLIGSSANDGVGGGIALTNGNYVILTEFWDNGSLVDAGAATWCDGTTGTVGVVSNVNSLVGNSTQDRVGINAVALSNGNYVVQSALSNNAGAITWCNGSTGSSGTVTLSNSLEGNLAGDGWAQTVVPLTNGNYVVGSPAWSINTGWGHARGAATWCDGTKTTNGNIDTSNSLTGYYADDNVGYWVTALTNGNYVVGSPNWDNSWTIPNAGAVTWANGKTGIKGSINSSNSLVGKNINDAIGLTGALPNGGYYVGNSVSPSSMTIGNGNSGTFGTVDTCNSFITTDTLAFEAYNPVYNALIIWKWKGTKLYIINKIPESLASSSARGTQNFTGNHVATIVDTTGQLICTIRPSGASPLSGPVTAKVYVQSTAPSYNGHAYLRRYYEITPANNPSTATATLTLYYTQKDFDDYNLSNGSDPDLPTGPGDATGISNFKMTQQHGTSSTGLPGNFNGWNGTGVAYIAIDPADSAIVWNDCAGRWEVTFEITGFSGFFSYGSSTLDPLNINSASKAESVSISPIPSTSTLTIVSSSTLLNGQPASITDIQGRDIYSFTLGHRQEIDVRNWTSGVYILRLPDGSVRRIVKD